MNGIFDFLHAFHAPSMTDYPLDAVSAAGLVCTHGKDNPGLGAPNSLKLITSATTAANESYQDTVTSTT